MMKRKLTVLAVVLCLVFSLFNPINSKAESAYKADSDYHVGKIINVSASKRLKNYVIEDKKGLFGAPSREAFWQQFSDDFFYNNMNQTQRRFYDGLRDSLDAVFYSDADCLKDSIGEYVAKGVSFQGLSSDEALRLYILFLNANPHYYFCGGALVCSSDNYGYPVLYKEYANGVQRSRKTEEFRRTLEGWIAEVKKGTTILERERNIYSLLARKLDYTWDSWEPHQSAATAVFTGITVCAGYSECFALLAKACGIKVLVITSAEHEWNQVKIGNYWYNVDITADDNGSSPDWYYFNKSDRTIQDGMHTPDRLYNSLGRPVCNYDFGSEPGGNNAGNAAIKDNSNKTDTKPSEEKPGETKPTEPKPSEPKPQAEKVPMYRVFDPNTGEHLYTSDLNEKNTLVSIGWKDEGIAWYSPKTSNAPVYRIYNPLSGEHHYTMDNVEKNVLCLAGWQDEGIKWYSEPGGTQPVYRLFNPFAGVGSHHYTVDINERDVLVGTGDWIYEGVSWTGM